MASNHLKDTTTVLGLLKQPSKLFPRCSEYNPQTHAQALNLITEVLKAQNFDHSSQIITMSSHFSEFSLVHLANLMGEKSMRNMMHY